MNILSQKLTNVLKNRLESKIKDISITFIDELIQSLTGQNNGSNNYLNIMSEVSRVSIEMTKEILLDVIKEFDDYYRESKERKRIYNVNKKNVPRTITTIIGDITFNRTYYETKKKDDYYFYIDDLLDLPKYDHYDPIVKGLAIRESFFTSQAQAGRIIGERITNVSDLTKKDVSMFAIPRQSVNNWTNNWNVRVTYDRRKSTPKTLYIMVDEKFIGCQDLDGDIMVKAFVVFEGVKEVSKGRRTLINRHVFTCHSSKPWEELLDRLIEIYDYEEIKEFYVLSDGGKWITSGINELKLESFQKAEHLLCMFHFKQALNHITTVEEERKELFKSFLNDKRKVFKGNLNKYLDKYPHRKETIEKKITYILNHYKAAKHMMSSSIGSSMEAHISHFIASTFASRPKGYSVNNISKYLMLNDAKNNGINIFNAYLQTYNLTEENLKYKESSNSTSAFKREESPITTVSLQELDHSLVSLQTTLSNLSKIDNEIRCF